MSQTQLMHHLQFTQLHLSPSPSAPGSWKALVLLWPWLSPHPLALEGCLGLPRSKSGLQQSLHCAHCRGGSSRSSIHAQPNWTTEALFLQPPAESIDFVPSSLASPAAARRRQVIQPGNARELKPWETNLNPETKDQRSQQTTFSPFFPLMN